MSESQGKMRFRFGCLGFVAVGIAALGVVVVSYLLWMNGDSDLRRVEAELRTAGLPTTWPQVGLVSANPDRQADWKRVIVLAQAVKSYQAACTYPSSWYGPKPGDEIPQEVVRYHGTLNRADLAELDDVVSRVGMDPIYLKTERKPDDKDGNLSAVRDLMRLYQERMALAPKAEIVHFAELMTCLVPARDPPSAMTELISGSLAGIFQSALVVRLADASTEDRRLLAALCDRVEALLGTQAILAARCRPMSLMQESIWISTLSNRDIGKMMMFSSTTGGDNDVEIWWNNERLRLGIRSCRARAARICMERAMKMGIDSDPLSLMKMSKTLDEEIQRLESSTSNPNATLLLAGLSLMDGQQAETRMILRLLAAECRSLPWPTDPRDPAGMPFRRFERDGKLIGAYSVGKNGMDDGGNGDDRCINLYGVCRLPKP